jgi:hypothetical protein
MALPIFQMAAIPQSNNEDVKKERERKGEHRSKCGQKQGERRDTSESKRKVGREN